MIKVSVMYTSSPGVRFDHAYYRDKHMPMVKAKLGDACAYYTIDQGLAGIASGSPPTYVAMGHIFTPSVEAYEAAMETSRKEIRDDIKNYTDATPVVQVSEVIIGH